MSVPQIRPVKSADVPGVVALVASVLQEFGLTFGEGSETDKQVTQLPESYTSAGGCFWIAETDDGSLLGTCGIYPLEDGIFELRKMYLAPTARGKGVGKALLAAARNFVKASGGKQIVLDTTEQMKDAIRFYEANGFVRDDAQVRGCRCSRGYSAFV